MKEEGLLPKIQSCFDKGCITELALTFLEVNEMIELLQHSKYRAILSGSLGIKVQFLCTPQKVESLFIHRIKVPRVHTLYKIEPLDLDEDDWCPSRSWTQKQVVDFEQELRIIYEGSE